MDLELYRILVIPRLKDKTKKSTKIQLFLKKNKKSKMIKKKLRTNLFKRVMSLSGLLQNGSKNGKKHYFCQILKPASLTLTIKLWLSETNSLKKMVVTQLIK